MAFETFDTICVIRGAGSAGKVTATLNDVARDVTGWTGKLVVKKNKTDSDGEAVLNIDLSISDASAGEFTYSITGAQTATLTQRTYQAEIHLAPASGEPIKAQGLFESRERVYNG